MARARQGAHLPRNEEGEAHLPEVQRHGLEPGAAVLGLARVANLQVERWRRVVLRTLREKFRYHYSQRLMHQSHC